MDDKKQRSTIHIPRELHLRAKSLAALRGVPVEDVYEELVKEWLEKQEREKSKEGDKP